jgi:hypothetical protein
VILLAIVSGVWWLYDRVQQREAQRRREVMREMHLLVTRDGIKMYKTSPNQNVKGSIKRIDDRYSCPIWADVPEDFSGKGRVSIAP